MELMKAATPLNMSGLNRPSVGGLRETKGPNRVSCVVLVLYHGDTCARLLSSLGAASSELRHIYVELTMENDDSRDLIQVHIFFFFFYFVLSIAPLFRSGFSYRRNDTVCYARPLSRSIRNFGNSSFYQKHAPF